MSIMEACEALQLADSCYQNADAVRARLADVAKAVEERIARRDVEFKERLEFLRAKWGKKSMW